MTLSNKPGDITVTTTSLIAPATTQTIMAIQGAAHTSPLVDQEVTTTGVVTAVDSSGYYLQDPTGDGDIATSDAVFVFTGDTPTVVVGDNVTITGTVSEFFPGGSRAGSRNIESYKIDSL